MSSTSHLKEQLKNAALELGFDLAGVAGVADTPEHRFFPEWIDEGRAGEMKYLEARNETDELKRASLANAAPWARSVVVCALNYNTDEPYSTHAGSPSQGWISRYAWSQRDYHDVLLEKLRALETRLVEQCDAARHRRSPHLVLRRHRPGDRAHLRQVRRHRLDRQEHLRAESATRLMAVSRCHAYLARVHALIFRLPTSAARARAASTPVQRMRFPAPYQMDATKCIAYLTIELRGSDSRRISARHWPTGLRVRHLPGCLPLEPARSGDQVCLTFSPDPSW